MDFFARYPRLEREPFYDTAGSVKMIMQDRPEGAAAIASEIAAKIYGAKILKKGIEDDPENHTRFFLLEQAGAKPRVPAGAEPASRSGRLHSVLPPTMFPARFSGPSALWRSVT